MLEKVKKKKGRKFHLKQADQRPVVNRWQL